MINVSTNSATQIEYNLAQFCRDCRRFFQQKENLPTRGHHCTGTSACSGGRLFDERERDRTSCELVNFYICSTLACCIDVISIYLDISFSRLTNVSSRSRLRPNAQRIGLGLVGLVHISGLLVHSYRATTHCISQRSPNHLAGF